MSIFAEIAFPTAVRRTFTYQIPDSLLDHVELGKRVWVSLRSGYSIGVIVELHDQVPEFKTKPIRKVLDNEPILSKELLKLTKWMHQFYFCSWGEVIQAALPAGLNYSSIKKVRVAESLSKIDFSSSEQEIMEDIESGLVETLDEANKKWKGTSLNKFFRKLIKENVVEVWEEPDIKVTEATERAWVWAEDKNENLASDFIHFQSKKYKWIEGLEIFSQVDKPLRNSETDKVGLSDYVITKLKNEFWIEGIEVPVESNIFQNLDFDPDSIKKLNKEQEQAFNEVWKSIADRSFTNYLLKGITGSGKTEVYIHSIKRVRELGKGAIVLVPEIALTPQTVSRFYRIFGKDIAVLHSRMTARERLESWNKIQSGEKKIVIGARSAVFAPVHDLGIIIIDEEHDASYKQMDPSPRYHAREVAIVRANHAKAVVVLGSATPSMQALEMTHEGKAELLELRKRHEGAKLPEVEIIDLKQYTSAMKGELSIPLYLAMEQALKRKEQIILLFNRRGFANYLQCETCGHIPQSPECSVSLTYHKRKNQLICHYSGYSRKADTYCEKCGSEFLSERGSGTQKIEEQLEEFFPKAKILRFDRDSTARKGAHERILNAFSEGEADILVGTQLVAKGLDFPNVTVVGVTDADTELAFPSFQSSERMFQLLSQVSGRSGRGEKPGKVFIQTRQPEIEALKYAQTHDYDGFSESELKFRESLNYPPYSRLVKFVFKGKKENQVQQSAFLFKDLIEKMVPQYSVLGPSPAAISWMNSYYFWEVILKIPTDKGQKFMEILLEKIIDLYGKRSSVSSSSVRININVGAIR